MVRAEVLAHIRQKRNLEVTNEHAYRKELETITSRAKKLREMIEESEATVKEYDNIISAIEKSGGV